MNEYKEGLLKKLKKLKKEISYSKNLKDVFDNDWFKQVKKLIIDFKENCFGTEEYTIFIGFIHDERSNKSPNIIEELDSYYGIIKQKIGNNRIKSLRGKLKRIGNRNFGNYFGSIYEIIVIGKFTENGSLFEYEPKIEGTNFSGDAIIEILNQKIFVEATSYTPNRPKLFGREFFLTIKRKIKKITTISMPFLLCIYVDHQNVHDPAIFEGIEMLKQDKNNKFMSALMISNYYRANSNKIWINQNSKIKINEKSLKKIKEIFIATDLKLYDWE